MSRVLNVLIACEESGTVRREFRALGHSAWSCDLVPCSDGAKLFHIQGDAVEAIRKGRPTDGAKWDLIIAHPPCTRITNTGVQWLKRRNLWSDLEEACRLFKAMLDVGAASATENPIPHKYALALIGRKYDQLIQPWMFGHMETKATCLWLNGLPKLVPTSNLKKETMALPEKVRGRLHHLPPSADRAKLRSITYPGIAKAMASQWSAHILNQS